MEVAHALFAPQGAPSLEFGVVTLPPEGFPAVFPAAAAAGGALLLA